MPPTSVAITASPTDSSSMAWKRTVSISDGAAPSMQLVTGTAIEVS